MPTITLDLSDEEDQEPKVEFGTPSNRLCGTNVEIKFDYATIEMSYEQAEYLYKELKPFFEVEDEEENQ